MTTDTTDKQYSAVEELEKTTLQLIETTSLAQYWMIRAEAAEKVVGSIPQYYVRGHHYNHWQEIVNNPPK